MQVVVLAGGLGTRLGSLTAALPKALIPVAGRPFAHHQLAWLAGHGVDEVVYCIGHLGDQIRAEVGDGSRWGVRVRYVDEGERLRGTAGALRLAYEEGVLAPGFGVLYGDSYLTLDLAAVFSAFERRRPHVLMTVFRNEDRFDRSNVVLSAGGAVLYDKSVEDPAAAGMHHIDYGFSVVDRDLVLPQVEADRPADLADVCSALSRQGLVAGFEATERFYEVGSPGGLAELEALLTAKGDRVRA